MTSEGSDIVIVGGGIMGSATASALADLGLARSVTVLEKDPSFAYTSTGRSCGGIRMQFSTPENIRMSQTTRKLIDELADKFGADADIAFRPQGYLILATEAGRPILLENAAIQRETGAKTRVLGPSELSARYPWLNAEGLAAGSIGADGVEGWCDPASLHALFRRAARDAGVKHQAGTAAGFDVEGRSIATVVLDNGERLPCDVVVNAAGAWGGAVAGWAGIDLPVEPRKRYVYVFDCREATDALHRAPLTVLPEGIYFRPEGNQFLCGRSPSSQHEPSNLDLEHVDHTYFEEHIWPILAERIPAFEAIKVTNSWAGYYDYNTFDQNAVIGPHPEVSNLFFINGFSGHGIQQAAAAGQALAELIVLGRFESIDLSRFGFERIAADRPMFERNVI